MGMHMFRRIILLTSIVPLAFLGGVSPASAAPGGGLSGAIFTTDVTGAPVNLNNYLSKQDVYLNGGPGINAPVSAAGLPAGTYSFQVTNPNGKVLLSEDNVSCRQFTVDGSGRIATVFAGPTCTTGAHNSSTDLEDQGKTVQLYPFADTPNPGGVYKVWVTPTSQLNCTGAGNKNCFVPRYSKTDNFKVRADATVELDTRFWSPRSGSPLLGMAAGWTDTNGASNVKYSEFNPAVLAYNEAHVEAVEEGTHRVTVSSQPGCTIDHVVGPLGETYRSGSGKYSIAVTVAPWNAGDDITYRVEVFCK
jgi:hypothetical protein